MIDRKACERLATMGFLKCTEMHLTVTEKGAPLLEALLGDIVAHQLVST